MNFHRLNRSLALAMVMVIAPAAHADPLPDRKTAGDVLAETTAQDWRAIEPEDLLVIDLEHGRVFVMLSPALARGHVARMRALVGEKFYDGLSFYRVIDGFVAQAGDVFETRTRISAKTALDAEFDEPLRTGLPVAPHPDADGYAPRVAWLASLPVGIDPAAGRIWHLHCAGALAMARGDGRDTASTEFYITLQPQRYLDRNLSVFGRVIEGMEHLQALRRVAPPASEADDAGEKIVSMRIAADLPAAERPSKEILDSARPAFAAFAEARRNRSEAFFYHRPDHLDICALSPPVRDRARS